MNPSEPPPAPPALPARLTARAVADWLVGVLTAYRGETWNKHERGEAGQWLVGPDPLSRRRPGLLVIPLGGSRRPSTAVLRLDVDGDPHDEPPVCVAAAGATAAGVLSAVLAAAAQQADAAARLAAQEEADFDVDAGAVLTAAIAWLVAGPAWPPAAPGPDRRSLQYGGTTFRVVLADGDLAVERLDAGGAWAAIDGRRYGLDRLARLGPASAGSWLADAVWADVYGRHQAAQKAAWAAEREAQLAAAVRALAAAGLAGGATAATPAGGQRHAVDLPDGRGVVVRAAVNPKHRGFLDVTFRVPAAAALDVIAAAAPLVAAPPRPPAPAVPANWGEAAPSEYD